jgi:kinesin family member 3B
MSKKVESVKVAVRCRPMSRDERKDKRLCIVKVDSNRGEISIINSKPDTSEPPKSFTFDCTYGEDSSQEQVYSDTGYPIVESSILGYNGTIFAYGQTGTGKTFTMEGEDNPHENRGIIPRSFEQIFYAVEQNPNTEFLIRVSFLEIYNEEIHDLLSKDAGTKLDVKEKQDSGFYVKDLNLFIVKGIEEMKDVMASGRRNRHTGQTNMNRDSSRSHSIFSIVIERSEKGADGVNHIRAGKLNLVDLAGSERQSKTGATGDRLKEATNINKSLLTLGNVISSLVDGASTHIPYRDSKLTKLLADSLGGNTKTLMIANVGPADWNYDETISTLRYANRAKNIQNKPKINEDPKDALLREYQDEISRLRAALELQGTGGGGGNSYGMGAPINGPEQFIKVEKKVYIEDQQKFKELEEKLEREKYVIEKNAEEEIKKIEAQRNIAEDEKQRLIEKLRKQEESQKKAKEKQQKLLKKLKHMEEKVSAGPQIMEQAIRQEQELQKANQELEARKRQEREIERKLREKEEEQNLLEQRFSSLQEEIEVKNKKLKKIAKKVQESDQEIKDLQQEFRREKEDMFDTIRVLSQQLKLKTLLVDNFVPREETEKIEKRAQWDENEDDWVLKEARLSKQTQGKRPSSAVGLKQPTSEYARIAKGLGDTNTRFRHDNILSLDLELPERTTEDYNGFVSGKIKNVINTIINDIDDDSTFVPIESYTHTEEEKPKQPGKRPGSARRPGTAKKTESEPRPPSQKSKKY